MRSMLKKASNVAKIEMGQEADENTLNASGSCHLLSVIVPVPPLLFAVVVMVDFPTTIWRDQGAQQRAASTSNQSTAKRIIAQQVASRRSGTGPKRTTRRRAPLGMVQRACRYKNAAGQQGNSTQLYCHSSTSLLTRPQRAAPPLHAL